MMDTRILFYGVFLLQHQQSVVMSYICLTQKPNNLRKLKILPNLAKFMLMEKNVFMLIIEKMQWNMPKIIIAGVMGNGILLKIGELL